MWTEVRKTELDVKLELFLATHTTSLIRMIGIAKTKYLVPLAIVVPPEYTNAEGGRYLGAPLHTMEGILEPCVVIARSQDAAVRPKPKQVDEKSPHKLLDLRNEFISAGFSKDEAFELVKAVLSRG